jgi:hypothetical protein
MHIVDGERSLSRGMLEVGASAAARMLGPPCSTGLRGMLVEPEYAVGNEREAILTVEDGIGDIPFVDGISDLRPARG